MHFKYIILFLVCTAHAQTMHDKFKQLQQNPGYKGMSKLEIAVNIEDFKAIRHFAYQATQEELTKAQELLSNKIDILKINIKELKKKFLSSVNKVTAVRKLIRARNLKKKLERELRDLNRRIT